MLVPRYWAEAKAKSRTAQGQVTVLRFGWSDQDQASAEEHARGRANEALEQIQAGADLPRRERKVPYNGADGLPIREEILETFLDGDAVVTRNSYGARCLNVTDVLFADVDFDLPTRAAIAASCVVSLLGFLGGMYGIAHLDWPLVTIPLGGIAGAAVASALYRMIVESVVRGRGGPVKVAADRARRFVDAHPEWRLRTYVTPNGLRILAMHRTFDPQDDLAEIEEFFRATGSDPMYRRMCRLQRCFRARLTPKPWRVGIRDHLRPRPGIWPVNELMLPVRREWIERYERASEGYAACRFLEAIGSETVDPRAAAVRDLHDERARATSDLPLA